MSGLRIGMVVYGDIRHDSRVQREALALAGAGHRVTLYCLADTRPQAGPLDTAVRVVRVPGRGSVLPGTPSPFARSGRGGTVRPVVDRVSWLTAYVTGLRKWGGSVVSKAGEVDVWHVHDFTGLLALAARVQRDKRLVYDVHDLFTETGSGRLLPSPARDLIRRYERRLVRRVDLVVTVNRQLGRVFERRCRPRRILVVHNCSPRWRIPEPRPNLIREAAGLPASAPLVLYHGLLSGSRGIERLMEAMLEPGLETAHLALLGYGPRADTFSAEAKDGRYGGRIHVLPAVLPSELLPWVASADVGALAMPKDSLNLFLSTPNKLFECLAAGVPVVVSSFPAVHDIVIENPGGPLGAECDPSDTADVARAIRELLALDPPEQAALRDRCMAASEQRWNWESEVAPLVTAYAELADAPSAPA
jgi:alpha-maltose-1-phosphate synthase